MNLTFEALIEHWPSESLLFVRNLPGLQVSGRDAQELQQKTTDALRHHLEWLVWHELIARPEGEVDLAVIEQAKAPSESIGPRFVADLVAPTDDEIELALAVGRATLTEIIDSEAADSEASVKSMRHLARLDRWYASRLTGEPAETAIGDPVDDLIDAAGSFEEAVDSVAERGLPELFERDGEEWTLAKLLRRRTGHLREHAPVLTPSFDDLTEDDDLDDDDLEV
jgi:hypothetical protein